METKRTSAWEIPRFVFGNLGFLAVAVVVGLLLPRATHGAYFGVDRLSVHLLLEVFSVVVAAMIVCIHYFTFAEPRRGSSTLLLAGFVCIGAFDLMHALAYEGMPRLVTGASTERAIYFWFAGRVTEVTVLLLLAARLGPRLGRNASLAVGCAFATAVFLGGVRLDWFPRTFDPATGVTPFKNAFEWTLALSYLALAVVFFFRARFGARPRAWWYFLAAAAMACGEPAYVGYAHPGDLMVLYGHLFKVAAYAFLFQAGFSLNLKEPFDELRASRALALSQEARLRTLSDSLLDTMVFQLARDEDGLRFRYVSAGVARLFDASPEEATEDASKIDGLFVPAHRETWRSVCEDAFAGRQPSVDVILQVDRGTMHLWVQVRARVRSTPEGGAVLDGVMIDVTDRHRAEEEVERLGFYDDLTGLPNRRLVLYRLDLAMTAAARENSHGALLFLDLDDFKGFNDTLGHETGDELLRRCAERIAGCLRAKDTVSRFGGDEFLVILEDLDGAPEQASAQARRVAEKILRAMAEPFLLGSQSRHASVSIGIHLFGPSAQAARDIEELRKGADLAMYRAKASGRNQVRFFDPAMQETAQERAVLETGIRRGLMQEEFLLHYQPQIEHGRMIGVEALIRWQHPDRGMIPPSKFIPLAEETGLIHSLWHFILDTACRQLVVWAKNPRTAHLTLAVNVSVRQFFREDFVEHVLLVLRHFDVPRDRLKFELTESLMAEDVELIIEKMNRLREAGITFALDDFGTGYSSLSYLKRFPLAVLKIDQSFVRDIHTDPHDASITRTIINLGHSLGLRVIAEGVETEDQRAFLAEHGCTIYQGYLFHRPMPVADLQSLLERT